MCVAEATPTTVKKAVLKGNKIGNKEKNITLTPRSDTIRGSISGLVAKAKQLREEREKKKQEENEQHAAEAVEKEFDDQGFRGSDHTADDDDMQYQ